MRKDLEWEYADAEVSETKIKEIGLQLGFQLPQDYIDCVKINGGASVLPEEFNVGNVERCFGSLFSFDEESSEYIVKKYEIYKLTLPQNVFPIAIDPAGNLICLDYKNNTENPIVVFWEHENAGEKEMLMHQEGLTEAQVEELARENVFYIADTFTDFLSKLHD
ncbi:MULTISPECIES: SMI1/KNR4 family protein [Bacillus]|uniref:SMI1/KNR4 family protein n=1 Tax=Bacillus anthracis TaxID=1392 RepID=A0A0J1HVQ8_BACAN|nr:MULTISPECIES: SMI1/KNR4 family protein [Bacillus]KLV17773.1 SMI1/KNR4 family protein [Bacillus anthracis]MDA2044781.1 SMI1/KNR4 family protein [Bacillus cereus]MDA2474356.1 SMI1/KNR4 family protein [Bacillus cereus]MDE7544226.1 SMI1/KNR4 family protein [Bacillus cereus]MDX9639317.1 SMI1/KNR4 family protein [Bacillus sp. PBL-C9]